MAKERKYSQEYKQSDDSLLEFYDTQLQIVMSEMTDTLKPSVLSSEACQIVLQLMMQNAEYTKKYGKSDRANENAAQLKRLFILVSQLNEATGAMNTLKLQNKSFYAKLLAERELRVKLQVQLDNITKAEQWKQEGAGGV